MWPSVSLSFTFGVCLFDQGAVCTLRDEVGEGAAQGGGRIEAS